MSHSTFSFIFMTWLTSMSDRPLFFVCRSSFLFVRGIILTSYKTLSPGDMTHSRVRYDFILCVSSLINTRDLTHLHAWHNLSDATGASFTCISTGASFTCITHALFKCVTGRTGLHALFECVTGRTGLHALFECVTRCTGWRRGIRCHIVIGHFPQKRPRISGSFAESDVQNLKHPLHLRHCVFLCVSHISVIRMTWG